MNHTLLQTFIAVMDTKSVSYAALELHVTQPAVTKRIQQLESELSTVLFNHIGRRLEPTAQAVTLYPTAVRWLKEYKKLQTQLQFRADEPAGLLRIGTSHHIGLHYLEPLLRQYSTLYPEVELDIHFVDSEQAYQLVQAGDLEAAYLTMPPHLDEKMMSKILWQDPLHIVASTLHPISQKKGISLIELCEYPAILPKPHTYTTQITLSAFKKFGLTPNATTNNNSLESIRMLVSVGLGWSVLPVSLMTENLARVKTLETLKLERSLGLIWHKETVQSPALTALINVVV